MKFQEIVNFQKLFRKLLDNYIPKHLNLIMTIIIIIKVLLLLDKIEGRQTGN